MITTYTNLQTAINNWLNRTDGPVTDFIALCEADLRMEQAVAHIRRDVLTISGQVTALPTDFKEPRFLYHNGPSYYGPIQQMSPDALAEWDGSQGGGSGVPQRCAYTENGDRLLVAPTPDGAYATTIIYIATLTPLSATNATNWVLAQYPNLYLYGSLIHSAPYFKDEGRLPMWEQEYAKALEKLRQFKEREELGGPLVMRPKRAIG